MNLDNKVEETRKLHPFDIYFILKRILQDIGSRHLLDCRLVNHFWNEVAVEVLKERQWVVHLDSINAPTYFGLVQASASASSSSSTWTCNPTNYLKALPLNLYIESQTAHAFIPAISDKHNGPWRTMLDIISIQYNGCSFTDKTLIKLLKLVSCNLEDLQLNLNFGSKPPSADNQDEPLETEDATATFLSSTSFTNLKSIALNCTNCKDNTNTTKELQMGLAFSTIAITSATNLRTLALIKIPDLWLHSLLNDHDQIMKQRLNSLLYELEIDICSLQKINALANPGVCFSSLKVLKIHQKWDTRVILLQNSRFQTFLYRNCPSLIRIQFYFSRPSEYNDHDMTEEFDLDLAAIAEDCQLKKVLHFSVHLSLAQADDTDTGLGELEMEQLSQVVIENLSTASQLFPCLKSFSTDFNIWISLARLFLSLGGNARSHSCNFTPRVFRSSILNEVCTMEIKVPETISANFPLYSLQVFNFLCYKLFPNVSKLIIINMAVPMSIPSDNEQVHKSIMKELLSLYNDIKHLEIRCVDLGWMACIVESRSGLVGDRRQGLKYLQLKCLKKRSYNSNVDKVNKTLSDSVPSSREMTPEFYLKVFLELVPSLDVVLIDEDLFMRVGNCGQNQIFDVEKIKAQFPSKRIKFN